MVPSLPEIITPELLEYIQQTYRLNWNGIHGYAHWVRVMENGLRLAEQNGANQRVVALFAFTHDMARQSDGWDLTHGPRAAKRIRQELQGRFFTLPEEELKELLQAVSQHTEGRMKASITVQTCWDADRLDLGRVGIIPKASKLCTPQARDPETLRWAIARSQSKQPGEISGQ